MPNYVIIGGGIAGTTAAEEIRKKDAQSRITIITEEPHPCYSRVLLPHYLKDKVVREKVFIKPADWYFKLNIELMSGVRVVAIDAKNKFVSTSEQREIPYDKLLVAVGGTLNLLPEDKRGVCYLNTIDDADVVKAMLQEVKTLPVEERHALVYGGGFISCEFANIFAHHGISFTILMRGEGFWSQILSPESQAVLARHAKQQGVEVVTGVKDMTLLGDDTLMGVRINNDREIAGRMMGVGIGLHVEKDFVGQSGLTVAGGILASESLASDVADIYVAGDAAEFVDGVVGRRVKYGNWLNALQQGKRAGQNMAGEVANFHLASSYSTNLLGLHVAMIGDVHRLAAHEVRQTVASASAAQELFLRDGKLVGAVLIGDLAERTKLAQSIGTKL